MNTLSTHVLDTSLGRPAGGIRVTLERVGSTGSGPSASGERTLLGTGTTDSNGRLAEIVGTTESFSDATYRLRFDVSEYFTRTGREAFYAEVVVLFVVRPGDEHYHIPLLLSPFGYTTYRGS